MSAIKCFDVAKMVIDEATNQFKPLWKINDEKLDVLKQYCIAIDTLGKEFHGAAFNVSVDEIKMSVSITLTCEDITLENQSHIFYELTKRATTISFSVSEDGELDVTFVFPSLWEKA